MRWAIVCHWLQHKMNSTTVLNKRILRRSVLILLAMLVSASIWASPAFALDYNRENLLGRDSQRAHRSRADNRLTHSAHRYLQTGPGFLQQPSGRHSTHRSWCRWCRCITESIYIMTNHQDRVFPSWLITETCPKLSHISQKDYDYAIKQSVNDLRKTTR